MNILLVSESYWPNADGGALFERRLALGLIGRGNKVTVWAPGNRFASYTEQDGSYTIYRERAIKFWANPRYKVAFWPFWHARRIIRTVQPDVIHNHGPGLMGLAILMWAKIYRIPILATNHFMPENALLNLVNLRGVRWLYKPLHSLIWSYLVWFHNRVDFVTSPTPTAVQLLKDHGLRTPSEAITNGIDMQIFKPGQDASKVVKQYHLATDRPVLIYVGRLDGEKRLDLIVSALPEILKAQPVQLLLVGAGKAMDELKAQAKQLGVAKDVIFTGYIDEADKPLIYNASTMFLMSSPSELQSIVMLEAMATELPIISVDVAALKELCHDGQNGYLFPRDDFHSLAARVNILLSHPADIKKFGHESLNIVRKHHSTEVTFEKYESAYKKIERKARS
jgi:glycosyltransferase involved in cell wall biosynthesis